MSETTTDEGKRRWLEPASAILMALATLSTAWCSYQSSKWSGQSSDLATSGARLEQKAALLTLQDNQVASNQIGLFSDFVNAKVSGNEKLAQFYSDRFPPELRAAFDRWMEQKPFENPKADPHPFMPGLYKTRFAENIRQASADAGNVLYAGLGQSAVIIFTPTDTVDYTSVVSTVTVNVPYGMTEFFDFKNSDPQLLIESWSTLTSQASGTPAAGAWLIKKNAPLEAGYPFHGTFSNLLLMSPDHASVFGKAGWTPSDIRHAIHRKTKLTFRQIMLNQEYDAFMQAHPELSWLLDAPETLVTVNPSPDCFEFFVVGGSAGRSQFCFGGTHSVTKQIRVP